MGLSRPDPTGLVKFISKRAGCQVSGKPGCVPKSSENLSGQADFLPGPVPFCFSSHSGAPEG